jgi:hypothetical protein
MRFFVSLLIGFLIGLLGLNAAFSQPGDMGLSSSISFLVGAPIVVPIIGGILHFAIGWLKVEPDHEISPTVGQRIGHSAAVMIGLLLGVAVGILFAGGLGG